MSDRGRWPSPVWGPRFSPAAVPKFGHWTGPRPSADRRHSPARVAGEDLTDDTFGESLDTYRKEGVLNNRKRELCGVRFSSSQQKMRRAPRRWDQTLDEGAVVENASVLRRQLCSELRGLRVDGQLTQKQVANGLGWSISKLLRIEMGAVLISKSDLDSLLSRYGITAESQRNPLHELQRACSRSQRGTTLYAKAYAEAFDHAFGANHAASGSAVVGQKNKLISLLSAVRVQRDQWIDLESHGSTDISDDGRALLIKATSSVPDHRWPDHRAPYPPAIRLADPVSLSTVTADDTSPIPPSPETSLAFSPNNISSFAPSIVAFLGRILSMLQSAIAKLMLVRVAVAAYSLSHALIVAAFMSHRHRHEPADENSSLLARYRPLAGVAAAF
jgi:transcriptional regulator with XRE-family HTH domain